MSAKRGRLFSRLNLVTVVVNLVCYALVGLALYDQLSARARSQTQSFVEAAGRQVTSAVSAFTQRYQWDAEMLCADSGITSFLEAKRENGQISYPIFVQYRNIAARFSLLMLNDPALLSVCLMKDDPHLLGDGKYVLPMEGAFLALARENPQLSNRWVAEGGALCLLNTSRLWPDGMLLLRIDEGMLNQSIGVNGEGLDYYVVDQNRAVLSSSERELLGQPLPKELLSALDSAEITNGPEELMCYSAAEGKLQVLVAYDVSDLNSYNAGALAGMMLLVVAAMLVSIALISFMGRRFSRHIQAIVEKLGLMQAGGFRQPLTLKTGDELELIDQSVCDLGNNVANLNQSLLDAAQRQKTLELHSLQMQINRHFLHNSLSSLRWIAVRNNQAELAGLMENLIAFYKLTLSQDNILPLREELALVENYVRLENVIHLGDLHFHLDVPPEILDVRVCKMTLQPFVENAIHHGKIQGKPLDIWLSAEKIPGGVVLRVEDNGLGIPEERQEELRKILQDGNPGSGSIGIYNTLSRLKNFYGGDVDISIMARQGTAIEIMLPLSEK